MVSDLCRCYEHVTTKSKIYTHTQAKDNEEKNNKIKLKLGLAKEKRINHERVVGAFVEI